MLCLRQRALVLSWVCCICSCITCVMCLRKSTSYAIVRMFNIHQQLSTQSKLLSPSSSKVTSVDHFCCWEHLAKMTLAVPYFDIKFAHVLLFFTTCCVVLCVFYVNRG